MREIVDRLLDGKFNENKGRVEFSTNKIEIEIVPGQKKEIELQVWGDMDKNFYGEVGCRDARMECYTKQFSEKKSQLHFCFHGENLMAGEVVKGEIYVITNQGEAYVPFVVSVVYCAVDSSIGKIKNLFHFANLAKVNWDEAVACFYEREFVHILKGNDKQYEMLYRGLSIYPGNEHNVDEFLIGIHKKQAIDYFIEERNITITEVEGELIHTLEIIKDGWGYVDLRIEVLDDILRVEKEQLKDADFLGNICRLPIFVNREHLHSGNNYGKIRIYNGNIDLSVTVEIKLSSIDSSIEKRKIAQKKNLMLQIMEFYKAFRLKKISATTWQKESQKIIDEYLVVDKSDIGMRLYQAQLAIATKRYNEAKWFLNEIEREWETSDPSSSSIYLYYLYLTTLLERDEIYTKKVADKIQKIFEKQKENWKIAWFLLFLSEELNRNDTKKWEFLMKQCALSCTSPFLYLEMTQLLQQNPTFIEKLGRCEINLLRFIVKNDAMTSNIAEHITYLAERVKKFDSSLFHVLEGCYEVDPKKQLLQVICSMLMKENKVGTSYAHWFEKAVESQLNITSLYEHYMACIDVEKEMVIPKTVFMYFSYQSQLDYVQKAYLYVNLYKQRESYPQLWIEYQQQIISFLQQQILALHINQNLALLYKECLKIEHITEQMVTPLSKLLSIHRVTFQNQNEMQMKQFIVRYPVINEEIVYGYSEYQLLELYGNDSLLLVEDMYQNRYYKQDAYLKERLLGTCEWKKQVGKLCVDNVHLDLGKLDYIFLQDEQTSEMEEVLKQVIESPLVVSDVKKKCQLFLLEKYQEYDRNKEMELLLENIPIQQLSHEEIGNIVALYLQKEQYDKGYKMIEEFGFYHIALKVLVRFCNYYIEQNADIVDSLVLAVAEYTFVRGKYTEQTLSYLNKFSNGRIQYLRDIWKVCQNFQVDSHILCERIIIQLLFANGFIAEQEKIFTDYLQSVPSADVEMAYLTQMAYDYFIDDKMVGMNMFCEMLRLYRQEQSLSEVCKLAIIKKFADHYDEADEVQKTSILAFVEEMIQKGKYFNALKKYHEVLDIVSVIMDKTILEHKAESKREVVLHYMMISDSKKSSEYCLEKMNHIYGNFYTKSCVLFFGESMQYYIMEKDGENEDLTASGTLQNSDIMNLHTENKYSLINDIVTSYHLKDYKTVDTMLLEYNEKKCISECLFKLKEREVKP